MKPNDFDVQVLVVGAGPAGLAVATTLGRYGISTLVVEQRLEPSTLPRATVISTRSMELLRTWHLEEEIRAGGVDGDVWMWECETLARAAEGRGHEVGYPSRAQAALVSPTAPSIVPQDWLEDVVRRHLRRLPSVKLEIGTQVVAFNDELGGVRVTVLDRNRKPRAIRARFVVGADGAHSTVRSLLGVEMSERAGDPLSGVQVLFRAPLWSLLGDLRYVLYAVTTPSAPGAFLPAGVNDRWLYGPALPDPDPETVTALIRRGAGVDVDVEIERITPFRSPGEIARRFRVGRTFLAGDAAHRVTPRGGTGMNLAFLGGYDLGWKLAWVLNAWASSALLDTYEAERRVVAEHNVGRSTDPSGSRRRVVDELHVDLGGRVTHAWLPSSGGRISTVDLVGLGWTLFTGPSAAPSVVQLDGSAPVTVRTLDALTARALGIMRDRGLLVRPDGVPVSFDMSRGSRPFVGGSTTTARWREHVS